MTYDVAVVGLGAMGSSVALHLARRGKRVIGFDRFTPPHGMGSSHGKVRLIREAYYEDPLYVPLVRRAYELWRLLQAEAGGDTLLVQTGSLMIGTPGKPLVDGTLSSAVRHGVAHELLDAPALASRFPMFTPLDDMVGVFEPGSSLLVPERIIALHLELAARAGATLRFGEAVEGWDSAEGGIEVRVKAQRYRARQLVCCAGAWTGQLLAALGLPLAVERQVQTWWEPARFPDLFHVGRMPVSMWQLGDERVFYTMPDRGDGIKIGWHHGGAHVNADTVDREVSLAEHAAITDLLRRFVPHAKGQRLTHEVCLYTNTPDGHFIVDAHPGQPGVVVVSACSGHGFKFASAIGEAVADLVTEGACRHDLTPFRLSRWPQRDPRNA